MRGFRLAAALLCTLPWLRAWHVGPAWFAQLVDQTFFPLCHHWAGRVLILGGEAMCVCSRCAGLYAGLAVGFLAPAPTLPERAYARMLAIAIATAVLDVALQDVGAHAPYHPMRLATGAFVGWCTAAWLVRAIARPRGSLATPQHG